MSRETIDFRALSPFGMEANEIKITEINDKDIVYLKHVLANNGFIVFRQQTVSDADFVTFLNRLGQMTFTVGETPVLHPGLFHSKQFLQEAQSIASFPLSLSHIALPRIPIKI